MVTREQMYNADEKHINIYFVDGDIWKNQYVIELIEPEFENEELTLELEKYSISQSEIERIEILD